MANEKNMEKRSEKKVDDKELNPCFVSFCSLLLLLQHPCCIVYCKYILIIFAMMLFVCANIHKKPTVLCMILASLSNVLYIFLFIL